MATVSADMLTNRPSLTPATTSKPLPNALNGASKQKERAPVIPRVDVEPLYTTVKEHVGDKWAEYKEVVCRFVLGQLNQDEISYALVPILRNDYSACEAHNRLVMAIMLNATRDPPDSATASFVSANDKPSTAAGASKPGAAGGDAAEQRLKSEIMALPARDRHRIKSVQDDGQDDAVMRAKAVQIARSIRGPDMAPTSAGGYGSKTNWEGEIVKRYRQPLFTETQEWPDQESITARMVPACYEGGVGGGAGDGCAEYLGLACDTLMKDLLTNLFARVRKDGEGHIKTARYKRRLEKEEGDWLRGENGIAKNDAGLLPVEVEAMDRRKPLNMADLKLALRTGDSYLLHFPLTAARIKMGWGADGRTYDDDDDDDAYVDEDDQGGPVAPRVNGIHLPLLNGHMGDEMDLDGIPDTGWIGGAMVDRTYHADRDALNSLLDDCLAIGQSPPHNNDSAASRAVSGTAADAKIKVEADEDVKLPMSMSSSESSLPDLDKGEG